ncbi:MAG: GntR family transcriptional regulator [Chloroflexi bacterium]|nr:GntR family transcriptional regulator [Chloroflexota bacterium]
MMDEGLHRQIPVPLYYQLSEQLRARIESGDLAAGERIPSVQELSAQHSISPMTAQKAIAELVRSGLVEVRRGIGTFVAPDKVTFGLRYLSSFSQDALMHGLTPHVQLLTQELEVPPHQIAERLRLAPDERAVHLVRLRFYDETPAAIDESYLPASLCPGLEDEDVVTQSLYDLLETRHGLALDHATQTLEAVPATAFEARLLHISVKAPVALLRGITFLADGRPIENFKVAYRGDRLRFELQTTRLHKKG